MAKKTPNTKYKSRIYPAPLCMNYVYILKSLKYSQLYAGSTNNLKFRFNEHNAGKVLSTKRYRPWELIYYEAYNTERLAPMREKNLKYNGNAMRELKKRIGFDTYRQSDAGFTLIELVISIAIIALISAISVSNFRQGERQKRLAFAAESVTNALRNTQNFTLTSKQIEASICTIGVINDKAPASYILVFAPSASATLYGIDKCGTAHTIDTYDLPYNTRYQTGGYLLNSNPVSTLQIKFQPPFSVMTASTDANVNLGVFNSFNNISLIVEPTTGSGFRTVTIDGISGRIGE